MRTVYHTTEWHYLQSIDHQFVIIREKFDFVETIIVVSQMISFFFYESYFLHNYIPSQKHYLLLYTIICYTNIYILLIILTISLKIGKMGEKFVKSLVCMKL